LSENQWFRENEKELLETARVAREKREAERAAKEQAAARDALKKAHFMKCPKCGHDMAEQQLGDIKIDRCTFCEGVFFDAGELEHAYMKKDEERKSLFRRLVGL
jgi:ribosomal protein L32